jgi:hypothetical protein
MVRLIAFLVTSAAHHGNGFLETRPAGRVSREPRQRASWRFQEKSPDANEYFVVKMQNKR